MLPRLHLVADDAVLGGPGFIRRARVLLAADSHRVALHVRRHATNAGSLFRLLRELMAVADPVRVLLLVNDRADVMLAAGADGVHLGRRSMPVAAARGLLGADAWIGYSSHGQGEAHAAVAEGADFVFFGAVYPTASHPQRTATGIEPLRATAASVDRPVLAIGGVTPERAAELRAAGAYGVAVLSSVWHVSSERDAVDAVREYRRALGP